MIKMFSIASLAVLATLTVAPSHALEPGQVVEVPAVCRSADAARTLARAVAARDEMATIAAAGPTTCLLMLQAEVPAYLLAHVTGPHGTAARWWSIWRARVGRAVAFVVVEDKGL